MNERIRKLCSQAISDVDGIQNPDTQDMYIPDCFAEKFAELIVRECAKVASDRDGAQKKPCTDAKEQGHGCYRAVKAENELAAAEGRVAEKDAEIARLKNKLILLVQNDNEPDVLGAGVLADTKVTQIIAPPDEDRNLYKKYEVKRLNDAAMKEMK